MEPLSVNAPELAGHNVQFAAPSAAYVSKPQEEQAVAAMAAEYEPAVHMVHNSDPFWDLYLPLLHAVHVT